jgi:hypothetical protein
MAAHRKLDRRRAYPCAGGLRKRDHGYGKRFIVRADEKLTAFVELERTVCIHLVTEQI